MNTQSRSEGAEPAALARQSLAAKVGNALFRYRDAVFPAAFLLLALVSRPRLFLGTLRSDWVLDGIGLLVALTGQALRAFVIGLAYIRRGGKDRRIHADELVQDGFFAHSRNPLYLGNMLVYLGLFIILNSTIGYAVGVPLFVLAYLCLTAAEEDFLLRRFGAPYEDYRRRVPRFFPKLEGMGKTVQGMRFDWQRLIRKEYGATFAWTTTALTLIYWESLRNWGVAASRGVLLAVLGLWAPIAIGYLTARYLKKTGKLRAA